MVKRSYFSTVLALYINYILQGMAVMILSQNMEPLMEKLKTNASGISIVISAIGVGRIISIYFVGRLSDKYGRKRNIWLGMLSYALFFGGILLSSTIWEASFFTLFAGFANAFLDTGTYPALMEAYPETTGFMSVLNKAFISLGQFILPITVSFLIANELYYGYSFIFCLIILGLNSLFMVRRRFPEMRHCNEQQMHEETTKFVQKPIFLIEGIAAMIFGFTSVSTFNIVVLWLPQYAEKITGMPKSNSLMLISVYSVGSIISVFLTSMLVKKAVKPLNMIIFCTLASFVVLILLVIFSTPTGCLIASFAIGLFSSGGIWQLMLAIFLELFPKCKGKMTSFYTLMTSISVMIIPIITGWLSEHDLTYVMVFNCFITFIGLCVSLIVATRYQKVVCKGVQQVANEI